MPSSDEMWRYEQAQFPKEQFWDQIFKWSGVPTIHFKDDKNLSSFDCPDTSHLDAEDAVIFTRYMINIVKEKLSL